MPSRVIKPKRDGGLQGVPWQSIEERAPSVVREEGPSFPRYVAVVSLMFITVGAASFLWPAASGRSYLIGPALGFFFLSLGMTGLLYHSFNEKDFQFRRLYGSGGFLLLIAAAILRVAPIGGRVGEAFLPYGALSLALSLGFLLSFIKNETEINYRTLALNLLGLVAVLNGLAGLIGGMVSESFLLQSGVIHLVLGLLFAAGYVGMEGISTSRGFWAGRFIGLVGLIMFGVALVRSLLPLITTQLNLSWRAPSFFLPSGLIFMYIGAEYLALYLGICSDNKLIVLTRRELGAFFYSPIVYIVLIGMAALGCFRFLQFAEILFAMTDQRGGGTGLNEPIFYVYLVSWPTIIPMIFVVPIITMRMISEEKRSGTLEVLLTTPVNEWHVVVAKFLAGLRIFMLSFYIWSVFFIALRIEGGKEFDYRPILTFYIALLCMGSGFIAVGIFFSSVTRHQIMAAVLTFVVMMVLTMLFFLRESVQDVPWLSSTLSYVAYIELYLNSARGSITPRLLIVHLSAAVFWLFLSIKVLEARKWS